MLLTGARAKVATVCMLMLACGPSPEERAWEAASQAESVEAYVDFVEQFPDSAFAETAKQKILTLREKVSWEDARSEGTISAYESHLETYPDSSFADEAHAQIEKLRYPFAEVGYEHLMATDKPGSYKCNDGEEAVSAGGTYVAEQETHVSSDDLTRLFHWDGVERLWRVPGDRTMAGMQMDDRGRPVAFGNHCLGNLQIEGSFVASEGLIFRRNTRIMHP